MGTSENVIIPDNCIKIGNEAFSGYKTLKSIAISENVTAIGESTFSGCTGLTSLNIPNNVSSIGNYAFSGCKSLKKITLPNDIEANNIGNNILENSKNAVVYVYPDTGALQWATREGVKYSIIGQEAPLPVQDLKAVSGGKNKINLTWKASEKADGYLIYAQKNKKYAYCGMTTKGNTYIDTKALDSDYNFYWVYPYSMDSNDKRIVGKCTKYVYAKGVTAAVKNLKATNQKGGVKLVWSKAAGAEGYLIYGKTASGKYGYISMTTKGTTFTHKLASQKEYNFYWVYPYHKDKNGKRIVGGTPTYVYGKAL